MNTLYFPSMALTGHLSHDMHENKIMWRHDSERYFLIPQKGGLRAQEFALISRYTGMLKDVCACI